jgi:hypothetical protein
MPYSLFDRYKQPDGTFADGGTKGDNLTHFLCEKVCVHMCGQPEVALLYVKSGLALLDDLKNKVWEDQESYDGWAQRCQSHFGSSGSEYFFWYWLYANGWSEHGGAVPGWLTDEGELLLALLREWAASAESKVED